MKRIQVCLKEQLEKRRMKQKELADITGIRPATIHDLYHDKSKQLPRQVLEKIVNALDIDDMNELLAIVDDEKDESF